MILSRWHHGTTYTSRVECFESRQSDRVTRHHRAEVSNSIVVTVVIGGREYGVSKRYVDPKQTVDTVYMHATTDWLHNGCFVLGWRPSMWQAPAVSAI